MTIPPVSNSEIGLWQRCRRHWYLKHVLWLAPPPGSEAPTSNKMLGYRIHLAFEADAKSGLREGPLYWVRQVYGAALLEHAYAVDEVNKERALAEVMVEGFEQWAAEEGLDEGIETIAAEHDMQVAMPGMPGIMLRGKLDRLIRRKRDSVILFRDWKTVGSLQAANDLPIASQPRFYTMLQRLAGGDARAEGGQYVYLLRSKRTVRATPPFYSVEEIRFDSEILNATYLKTKRIITEILHARQQLAAGTDQRDVVYPTPAASCAWDCPFIAMCPLMDSTRSGWQDMARGEFVQEDPYAYYGESENTGNASTSPV